MLPEPGITPEVRQPGIHAHAGPSGNDQAVGKADQLRRLDKFVLCRHGVSLLIPFRVITGNAPLTPVSKAVTRNPFAEHRPLLLRTRRAARQPWHLPLLTAETDAGARWRQNHLE